VQGQQTLRILSTGVSFNINWIDFSKSLFIEAENYSAMLGIQTQSTTDVGGGLNVGYSDPGDYMDYQVNIPATGVYTIDFRVASAITNSKIELRNQEGTTLASLLQASSTGGWQYWVTKSATANLTAGQQTLRIYHVCAGMNINWFSITEGGLKSTAESEIGQSDINIYPNPAKENINIELGRSTFTSLEIYDISGKLIDSRPISGVDYLKLELGGYKKGLYILNFKGNEICAKKMIVE
jgi:hypothetical protein